jgi:hypothetical protein
MTYPIGRWKAERGGKRFVVSEPEPSRVVVVVPLKAGVRDRVRELLEMGPPFDPEAAGLDRHQVFLTDQEAVFLFEAPDQATSIASREARNCGGPQSVGESTSGAVRAWPRLPIHGPETGGVKERTRAADAGSASARR